MHTADVIIVGGGCMGASTAYHLARRGLTNIILVERDTQLGAGSTGRNAGGVRHQFSDPANIALSKESIALFARFEQELGFPIDFWRHGYLFLLSTEASVRTFEANVALQRREGVDVEWLSGARAAEVAPGISIDGVLAATFCGADGVADPHGVTMGFAKAAQAMGVRLWRDAEVTRIVVARNRVEGVDTTRGPIASRMVVNAAGPWAGEVGRMAGIDVPIVPERRHIFIAKPDGDRSWDDPRYRGETPSTRVLVIDFDTTFYFHREGGGLLFGMADPEEEVGFDTTVRWDVLPRVTEVAVARLPALAHASVSHAWAGLYEMTPDHNPIIGASPIDGLFVIAGFSGHGFQHSPAAGRILADLIVGRDPKLDLTSFAFDRFSTRSGRGESNVV
ncbi:MAG: FAD-binding oxidoreductase [Acidobacteria bacterium]|nr:FAD-binding oxidoreductase [Acidobacteriota bacterium]